MKLLRKLIDWILHSPVYEFILEKIVPKIRFSTWYTRLSGDSFLKASRVLSPGQFIVSIDENKLSSILVPGFMSHAAFVVENNYYSSYETKKTELIEMIGKGYNESSFFDFCKEASRIIICDCLDWNLQHKDRMIALAPTFKLKKYDSTFSFGVEELYCSELIYQLDRLASPPEGELISDISDLAGIGKEYLSPDGLLFAANVIIVYDSDNELTGMTGPQAEEYCKQMKYIC